MPLSMAMITSAPSRADTTRTSPTEQAGAADDGGGDADVQQQVAAAGVRGHRTQAEWRG